MAPQEGPEGRAGTPAQLEGGLPQEKGCRGGLGKEGGKG